MLLPRMDLGNVFLPGQINGPPAVRRSLNRLLTDETANAVLRCRGPCSRINLLAETILPPSHFFSPKPSLGVEHREANTLVDHTRWVSCLVTQCQPSRGGVAVGRG